MTARWVKKDKMGRVFLPPAPSAELHINFGWNVKNGQLYPEWMPVFEEAISQKDYDALVSKIKDYLDKNAINELVPALGCLTLPLFGAGVLILGYAFVRACKITSDLKKIAGEYPGARIELFESSSRTAQTEDAMAFDQYGEPLKAFLGKDGRGQLLPVWPPLGYNIILAPPKNPDRLRRSWPKSTSMMTVMPASMVRDDDSMEKLKKLKELLDAGAISNDEYNEKKAELMKRI